MRKALVLMVIFGSACGSDVPEFDRFFPDPAPECVEGTSVDDAGTTNRCPAGQLCLGGRCFLPCEGNSQCASAQVCEAGVCVTGSRPDTGPPVDAGPVDAPVDPCEGVMCDESAPQCHPSGVCVGCIAQMDCTIGVPICDLAQGTCVVFTEMVPCAPCNTDFECDLGRTCTELDSNERVCLTPCTGGMCPQGFGCNMEDVCEPRLGTCTGLRNAVQNTACINDNNCVPLGVTPQPDTCRGEDVDMMIAGACVHLCGTNDQCPVGFTCDGTTCIRL